MSCDPDFLVGQPGSGEGGDNRFSYGNGSDGTSAGMSNERLSFNRVGLDEDNRPNRVLNPMFHN